MTALSPTTPGAPVLRRFALLLGWLSLFATLALLSPGVVATANAEEAASRAQRAEGERRPEDLTAGPSCPASAEAHERTAAELSQMIERMRSEAAEAEGDAGGVVSLNTRGYNYPTGTLQDERSDR